MNARLLIPTTAVVALATGACRTDSGTVRFASPRIAETSGMALSPTRADRLWLLDDSGGRAELQLADTNGRDLGTLRIGGARNVDWEDLASFRWHDRAWLLVGDIGDNDAARNQLTLHLVAEPPLPDHGRLDATATPEWSLEFSYEDGPRDCECLGVDVNEGSILLLSKRDRPPRLYHLPLAAPGDQPAVARFLGEAVGLPMPPDVPPHAYAHQPTALDIAPDGRMAVVLGYRGAYRIDRHEGESWAEAFVRTPELVGAHGLEQAEAIALGEEGCFVTTEGARPPLVFLPLPTP